MSHAEALRASSTAISGRNAPSVVPVSWEAPRIPSNCCGQRRSGKP
jgi:hypothetical protein